MLLVSDNLQGLTQLWGSMVSKRLQHMWGIALTDHCVAKAAGKVHSDLRIIASCLLQHTWCEHSHAQLVHESEWHGGMLPWPCVCFGAWAVALRCIWLALSCCMLQSMLEGHCSYLEGWWGRLSPMWLPGLQASSAYAPKLYIELFRCAFTLVCQCVCGKPLTYY